MARNEIRDFSKNPTLSFCTKYTEIKKIEEKGKNQQKPKSYQRAIKLDI